MLFYNGNIIKSGSNPSGENRQGKEIPGRVPLREKALQVISLRRLKELPSLQSKARIWSMHDKDSADRVDTVLRVLLLDMSNL